MTVSGAPLANINLPFYAPGCQGRGHLRLEFVEGVCFTCGRADPPAARLSGGQLAAVAGKRDTKPGGLGLLAEAALQTRLKMRALALLEDVDIDDQAAFEEWAAGQVARSATVDHLLAGYAEDDVRWAVKAAYV